jgi:hypothetical protein
MIAGTQYADRRGILLFKEQALEMLEKETYPSLTLVSDGSNKYDEFAIRVNWQDYFLGFVPASGLTCADCLSKVFAKHSACKTCGSTSILVRGLSYRISQTSKLNQYYCFLNKLAIQAVNPFHCQVYWSMEK